MSTKKKVSKKAAKIAEAKRQADATRPDVKAKVSIEEGSPTILRYGSAKESQDDGGSHSIDHLTVMDNHEQPDTNKEPREDIIKRDNSDLSFWNNSWTWVQSGNSNSDDAKDSWFINPTPELIGTVMHETPLIFGACEATLLGENKNQLNAERVRHLEFLRGADESELVSESLDMLVAYQGRLFEAVQRYLGLKASYDYVSNSDTADDDRIEDSAMKKKAAADVCRGCAAKLIALVEAYHEVVSDERAYNLQYNFSPKKDTKAYGLYRYSVETALNKIGRRLASSIKSGKMDAERYRIPRPWLEANKKTARKNSDEFISDFV